MLECEVRNEVLNGVCYIIILQHLHYVVSNGLIFNNTRIKTF